MTRSICFIIRVSSDSLLLYRSWIKAIWSTSEAAGAEATQQKEVTCCMRPVLLSEDFSWLCFKPNIPQPGHHHALCFLPLLYWVVLA